MIIYNDLGLLDCRKVSISCLSTSIFCILISCLLTAFLQVFMSSAACSEEWTYFLRLNTAEGPAPAFGGGESKGSTSPARILYLYSSTYAYSRYRRVNTDLKSEIAADDPADQRTWPHHPRSLNITVCWGALVSPSSLQPTTNHSTWVTADLPSFAQHQPRAKHGSQPLLRPLRQWDPCASETPVPGAHWSGPRSSPTLACCELLDLNKLLHCQQVLGLSPWTWENWIPTTWHGLAFPHHFGTVFPWDASHHSFACPLVLQPETGLGFSPFRFLTKDSSRLQSLDRFIFDLWLVDSTLPVLQSQKI